MLMFVLLFVTIAASGIESKSDYRLLSKDNNTVLKDPGSKPLIFSFRLFTGSVSGFAHRLTLYRRSSGSKEDKKYYYPVSSGRYNFKDRRISSQIFKVTLRLEGPFRKHEWYLIRLPGQKTTNIFFEVKGTDKGSSSSTIISYLAGPLAGTAVGIIFGICLYVCRRRKRKSRSAGRSRAHSTQYSARTRQQRSRASSDVVNSNMATADGNYSNSQTTNVLADPPPPYDTLAFPSQYENVGFSHDNSSPPPYHLVTSKDSKEIPLQELKVHSLPQDNSELPS